MSSKKAFTFLEILVVMVIIGILVAVALPNFFNSMWQTQVQSVESNLRAISAAEQKYYENNNNQYYISGSSNDFSGINSNLGLEMSQSSNGFTYTCSHSGNAFVCTASNASAAQSPNAVQIDFSGNLSCYINSTTASCP